MYATGWHQSESLDLHEEEVNARKAIYLQYEKSFYWFTSTRLAKVFENHGKKPLQFND